MQALFSGRGLATAAAADASTARFRSGLGTILLLLTGLLLILAIFVVVVVVVGVVVVFVIGFRLLPGLTDPRTLGEPSAFTSLGARARLLEGETFVSAIVRAGEEACRYVSCRFREEWMGKR